jgi:hypothetical protein
VADGADLQHLHQVAKARLDLQQPVEQACGRRCGQVVVAAGQQELPVELLLRSHLALVNGEPAVLADEVEVYRDSLTVISHR